jgi:transglutaminase-like putative cysteine protease
LGNDQKKSYIVRSFDAFLLLFLLGILVIGLYITQPKVNEPADEDSANRYFTIGMTVTYENWNRQGKTWHFSEEDKELGLFMNDSWQTVYLLNVSYPITEVKPDSDGNPIALLEFQESELEPNENLTYQVYYRVVFKPRALQQIFENRSGSLENIPEDLKATFCQSTGSWQSDDPLIRDLAFGIAKNETNVLSIISDFVQWITQNIEYESLEVPRYPSETLTEHKGDCDDQANLLIGLCRAVGIPAYLQIGCIYTPGENSTRHYWDNLLTSTLTNIGWHGWAVAYVPPWGWLPVDLTYSKGNRSDPLSHITSSAIMTSLTVQYSNVTFSNYVLESRFQKTLAISERHGILTHDIMIEEVQKKIMSHENTGIPEQLKISLDVSLCMTFTTLIMFFKRSKHKLICP